MDALLEPHHRATIDRMRHEGVVLVAQDSSSLCYTMHAAMQGIGSIGNRVDGPQGLMLHSALAFRPDGLPLGILDIEAWARDADQFGKRTARNATPIEAKESFKWIRALGPIGNAAAQCPSTRIITLADREADIFEYLLEARTRGLDVVVRAREKNRRLESEVQPLGMHLHLRPRAGTIALEVPRHGKQPARTAELSVRFDAVTLPPPHAKPDLAAIELWAVLIREEQPPKEVKEPLEWLLLTTLPVTTLVEAVETGAVVCQALGHRGVPPHPQERLPDRGSPTRHRRPPGSLSGDRRGGGLAHPPSDLAGPRHPRFALHRRL